jgi:DNA topoisomerase VI subunit A
LAAVVQSARVTARVRQVNKTTVMTRILQLVHEICTKGIHVTKRDLFYTDVKLFEVCRHFHRHHLRRRRHCASPSSRQLVTPRRTKSVLTLSSTT